MNGVTSFPVSPSAQPLNEAAPDSAAAVGSKQRDADERCKRSHHIHGRRITLPYGISAMPNVVPINFACFIQIEAQRARVDTVTCHTEIVIQRSLAFLIW